MSKVCYDSDRDPGQSCVDSARCTHAADMDAVAEDDDPHIAQIAELGNLISVHACVLEIFT